MLIDFNHFTGAAIADQISSQLHEQANLAVISHLKPQFSKDGNQYCFLYGQLPNDCIVGFGDTPSKAMYDFVHNFNNQKA